MNTNMAAATYHPQSGNVKPLTANSSLSFAVKWDVPFYILLEMEYWVHVHAKIR